MQYEMGMSLCTERHLGICSTNLCFMQVNIRGGVLQTQPFPAPKR